MRCLDTLSGPPDSKVKTDAWSRLWQGMGRSLPPTNRMELNRQWRG
jgi:hypothetical protein